MTEIVGSATCCWNLHWVRSCRSL